MRDLDEISTIQRWLDEAALAKAQAKLPDHPENGQPRDQCESKSGIPDLDKYKERFDRIFNPGVPLSRSSKRPVRQKPGSSSTLGLLPRTLKIRPWLCR